MLSPQRTPYETLRLELAIASLDWFLTPIAKSRKRFARQNCFSPITTPTYHDLSFDKYPKYRYFTLVPSIFGAPTLGR